MKKEKGKKRDKKKVLLTVLIVILSLAVIGFVLFQYVFKPIIVDYAFGEITDMVVQTMGNKAQNEVQNVGEQPQQPENAENTDGENAEDSDVEQSEEAEIEKRREEVNNMSVNEVASIVAADSGLIAQLEKIVSPADKEKVISILLSNFTKEEIAKYSAEVAAGITSQRKSELAAMARSRLTSAQWSQCMQLFAKYVDQLRPIIAEKIKN